MTNPYANCADELRARGMLPASYQAVYVAGSLVRGWGNALSDLDVYVVTDTVWDRPVVESASVPLDPPTLPIDVIRVDGVRWDVEYWSDRQVDQMLAKLGKDNVDAGGAGPNELSRYEMDFLERLGHARAVEGEGWLDARRAQLADSAFRQVMVSGALHYCDIYAEDAIGQLEAGDLDSAVLSARLAFGCAVDALLAGHGELGQSPKWRARRFRAADPAELSFEEYWATETMRDLDPAAPGGWVESTIGTCRRISAEVSL